MAEGIVTLVAGQKKSGKTFAANWLVRRARRLLVYDRTAHIFEKGNLEFDRFKGTIHTTFKPFAVAVDQGVTLEIGYREALVDGSGKSLNRFIRLVQMITEPPSPGRRPRNSLTVLFAEAHKTFPRRSELPPLLAEMLRTARHRRIWWLFETTKANDLPLELRELVDDSLIFRHKHTATLDYIGELLGREWREPVKQLPVHRYYKMEDTGEVTGPHQIRIPVRTGS